MEIQSITPELEEKGLRLDKVILNHMPDRSRTEIQKWIKAGQVIVNDNVEKANYKVEEEDVIQVTLPDPQNTEINPENIPLDIVYEDENILIVNKPYGLLSQSDQSQNQDCLVNRVQAYLMEKNEYDPNKEHSFAPSICHRLDRNTTGLVIAAKNANALRKVNEAIANRTIQCIEPMLWVLLNKKILLCVITFAKKIQLRR